MKKQSNLTGLIICLSIIFMITGCSQLDNTFKGLKKIDQQQQQELKKFESMYRPFDLNSIKFQTYENPDRDYTYEYPANWRISKKDTIINELLISNQESQLDLFTEFMIIGQRKNTAFKTDQDGFKALEKGYKNDANIFLEVSGIYNNSYGSCKIGKLDAYYCDFLCKDGKLAREVATHYKGKDYFIFIITDPLQFKRYLPIFDKILSSFAWN